MLDSCSDIDSSQRFTDTESLTEDEIEDSNSLVIETSDPNDKCDAETELKQCLANWFDSFNIPGSSANALLKGLKSLKNQNGTFDCLPLDIRTLLKTPRKVNLFQIPGGKYYHFGLQQGICRRLPHLPPHCISRGIIDILVSIDGIPLSKSSHSTFWPILGQIYGDESPFPVGVFHGKGKPDCLNSFLKPFVDEVKELKESGVIYQEMRFKLNILGFVCDAPARSFITGICGHTGRHACPKCETVGVYYVKPGKKKGRMTYPDTQAVLRTHESFIRRESAEHHRMRSIIEDLEIDMVRDMPLDYMHLVCLGVMRKLLIHWVKRRTSHDLITKANVEEISRRLELVRQYVPNEFSRLPRPLTELVHWKATEYRQFLLYTGPVVLHEVLPVSLYKHFLCLHSAIKLLSSEPLCYTSNGFAKKLLIHFVRESPKLYGEHFITYNVHCLVHLPDDVIRFGSLDQFSSFPFENFLQQLKRRIRRSNNPLVQLVKRLKESYNRESESLQLLHSRNANTIELKNEHKNGPVIGNDGESKQFKYAKLDNWSLSVFPPNNCVFLEDNSAFIIENIVERGNNIYIVGKQASNANTSSNFFNVYPRKCVPILNCCVIHHPCEDLTEWPVSRVKCKAIRLAIFPDDESGDDTAGLPFDDFLVYPLLMQDKSR